MGNDPQFLQRHIDELAEYMVVLLDREARIRSWNRGAHLLFQYTAEEAIGKHFRLLFTDDDVARGAPEEEIAGALRDGRAPDRRWHKRKDGSLFFSDGLTTVLYEDGFARGYAKIARDATIDRKNEAQLAEIQAITEMAHFSESLDDLLDVLMKHLCGVFGSDIAGILLADTTGERLTVRAGCGLERDIEQGLSFRPGEGFPGAVAVEGNGLIWDHPDPRRFISESLRASAPSSLMGVPLKIKGRLLGVLYLASTTDREFTTADLDLLKVAADRVSLALDNANHIENERRARDEAAFLADAASLLSSTLDYEKTLADLVQLSVPRLADWCAVDIVDERGRLRRISVAHEDPAKVELVRQLHEKYPPKRDTRAGIYRVLSTGQAELHAEIPDDLIQAQIQSEEHGEVIRSLGLRSAMIVPLCSRDRTFGTITFVQAESGRHYAGSDLELAQQLAGRAAIAIDNARLYREARVATDARDLFMATLSHEMRTPMTSILGWVKMLQKDPSDVDTLAVGLEAIERSARVQARLVDDLLDVSRIITGKLSLDRRTVDATSLIRAAVSSLEPLATAAGVHVIAIGCDDPVQMVADPERLRQVLTNLISNAIKFSKPEGLVTVELSCDETMITIVVSDTGRGISPELLPHVFEPFRQEPGMEAAHFGGLGLGLAIVHNLVEMHDGKVEAHSEGEGRGATFVVTLPRMSAETKKAQD